MKNNTYFKEGLFFVVLLTVMILSAGIGIVSLAGASSNIVKHDSQEKMRNFADFSQYDETDSIHMRKVSFAIENYRKAIVESSKATTSVMAVYWKIEAADSLSVVTQTHFNSIKAMLNVRGDELQLLAQPKNISALADKALGEYSAEKNDRKVKMNRLLKTIELNLNQLASI